MDMQIGRSGRDEVTALLSAQAYRNQGEDWQKGRREKGDSVGINTKRGVNPSECTFNNFAYA
jgi:hypothetical protein